MSKQSLVQKLKEFHDSLEERKTYRRAIMGRGVEGERTAKVPDRPGYVYVRNREDPRQVYQVLQGSAPDRPGWPVVVGPAEVQSTIKRIVDSDWPTITTWPGYSGSVGIVGEHHEQHEYGAFDMVNVSKGMIQPFRIRPDYPTDSWYVIIEADDAAYLGPRHVIFSGLAGYQESPVRGVRRRIFWGTGNTPNYDQVFTAYLTENLTIEFHTGTKRSTGGFPGGFPAPSGPFTTPSIGAVATQVALERVPVTTLLGRNQYPIGRVVLYETGTFISWKHIEPLQPLYTWPATSYATGIYVGDSANYYTGTTVEAALAEIGARLGGGTITGSVAYLNRVQTFTQPQTIRASGIVTLDVIAQGLVGVRGWSFNHIGLDGESAHHIGVYGGSVNNTAGWFEIKDAAKNVWPYPSQPVEGNTTSPVLVAKRSSDGRVRNGNLSGPILRLADEIITSGTLSGHFISAGLGNDADERFAVGRTGTIFSADSVFASGTIFSNELRPTQADLPTQRVVDHFTGNGVQTEFFLSAIAQGGSTHIHAKSLNVDYYEMPRGYSVKFVAAPVGAFSVEYNRGYGGVLTDWMFLAQNAWTLESGTYTQAGHLSSGSIQGINASASVPTAYLTTPLRAGLYNLQWSTYKDSTGSYSARLYSSDRTKLRWMTEANHATGSWARTHATVIVPRDDTYAVRLFQYDAQMRFDDVVLERVGPFPRAYQGLVRNGSFYDDTTNWTITGSFARSETRFRSVAGGTIRSATTDVSVASQTLTLEPGLWAIGVAYYNEAAGRASIMLKDGGATVFSGGDLSAIGTGQWHEIVYHVTITTRKTYTLELRSENAAGVVFTDVRLYRLN